jgi:K+-transporting ATPase KdpF subunit
LRSASGSSCWPLATLMRASGSETKGALDLSCPKTSQRNTAMMFDYALAGLVSAGLLFYLTYALLRPERF